MTSPRVQDLSTINGNSNQDRYLFVVCQRAAEVPFKARYTGQYTPLRLAFSRPGLVTFKVSRSKANVHLAPQWLARVSGHGLGSVRGPIAEELVQQALAMAGNDFQAIHIFQRDRALPGVRDFEPGPTELTETVSKIFASALARTATTAVPVNTICPLGNKVLDIILVEPDQWFVGTHMANEIHQCWPGGVFPIVAPSQMISRAYRKITEAIAWSQMPLAAGDAIVEIGSSPGGSCQRLLDLGLKVTGVDPAEMNPLLLAHPRFRHWRSKAAGIKRKMFSRFKWLTADANVAPNYTLDVVEDIVTYSTSRFEGLLLTFKLSSYDLIDQVEAAAERIRGWGFASVQLRQLASNRRECCLAALRTAPSKIVGK